MSKPPDGRAIVAFEEFWVKVDEQSSPKGWMVSAKLFARQMYEEGWRAAQRETARECAVIAETGLRTTTSKEAKYYNLGRNGAANDIRAALLKATGLK